MIGTPSPDTGRVLTYVPGTFTGLRDFYGGGVQQIPTYVANNVPGTIAFVYKDGPFPGENDATGEVNMLRIAEANDEGTARTAGQRLAGFEQGMRTDSVLGGAKQIAFGHSWGLTNVTSSEVAGARYDTVVSLSGAGMLPDWAASPGTAYTDLSYQDILQTAQDLGLVWDGNTPRKNPAFTHGDYYTGPDDDILDSASAATTPGGYGTPAVDLRSLSVLMKNHNLIATTKSTNKNALEDMAKLVKQ